MGAPLPYGSRHLGNPMFRVCETTSVRRHAVRVFLPYSGHGLTFTLSTFADRFLSTVRMGYPASLPHEQRTPLTLAFGQFSSCLIQNLSPHHLGNVWLSSMGFSYMLFSPLDFSARLVG